MDADQSAPGLLVVGVGASAGGIEALEGLFSGLSDRPGLAVVIVTHLNPHRESLLHEVVRRYTKMTVCVAVDEALVQADTVHVMPADATIGIRNGRLTIHRADSERRERKPVDLFFTELALDQGERAAGIVLSGGDGDGALGIKAIKQHGGLTLAQEADGFGPQHPDMPLTAIATGMVDLAIPATEMGAKLVAYAHRRAAMLGDEATGRAVEAARPELCDLLRNQLGHDFAGYKIKTFVRRVQHRMQILQLDRVEGYVARLRQDRDEVAALFRDLLINVTSFFRDPAAFAALAELVIPKLFEGRSADETVRLWVPGCATGEEVFSLAILLREHMDQLVAQRGDKLGAQPQVQIFATDIDEHALSVARAARYPLALLGGVSPERRRRFFTIDGASATVIRDVRDLCVFSPHSLTRDPPFSRIDLISCRNVLIYFGADIQGAVLPTFDYALRPGGILFLGTAETIGRCSELFTAIDKKHRIFQSRGNARTRLPLPGTALRGHGTWPGASPSTSREAALRGGESRLAVRQAVEGQVLDRYAPAHVVVSRNGDIVYFSARTGKYLEAAPGQPTRQILTLARRGLRLDLASLLREATESNRLARREHLAVEGDDCRVQMVRVTVDRLRDRGEQEPLFVVLFEDEGPGLNRDEAALRPAVDYDRETHQLERELIETRERLQSMSEEYETAIEELKSSNEELVSVNEEVQSSNEELEASKEELQSLNEELHTINAELGVKIDALDQANSDLQNLFESTDLATIFLDQKLLIRSFTPAVSRIFNILPGDRGRPITDLTSRLLIPDFAAELDQVLHTGTPLERRLAPQGGVDYLMRLSAYRDTESRIGGVVVAFVDISSVAQAQAQQAVLIGELQHRTRNLLAMVQAIAQQTLGKGGSLETYMHRLSALGRVQGLIAQGAGDTVELGEIVRLELEAHAAEAGKVSISGPPVQLLLPQVQTFALALHELATNAVKHGALRSAEGRLDISWSIQDEPEGTRRLVLDWVESGVEVANDNSQRRGYGRQLIERALTYALDAQTQLEFRPQGVWCRIAIPLGGAHG